MKVQGSGTQVLQV